MCNTTFACDITWGVWRSHSYRVYSTAAISIFPFLCAAPVIPELPSRTHDQLGSTWWRGSPGHARMHCECARIASAPPCTQTRMHRHARPRRTDAASQNEGLANTPHEPFFLDHVCVQQCITSRVALCARRNLRLHVATLTFSALQVPILKIPKAEALWNIKAKVFNNKKVDPIQVLHCSKPTIILSYANAPYQLHAHADRPCKPYVCVSLSLSSSLSLPLSLLIASLPCPPFPLSHSLPLPFSFPLSLYVMLNNNFLLLLLLLLLLLPRASTALPSLPRAPPPPFWTLVIRLCFIAPCARIRASSRVMKVLLDNHSEGWC